MVPGDMLVQEPPHPLDRVAVRAVRRQEVQVDPVAVLPQVDRHRVAVWNFALSQITWIFR